MGWENNIDSSTSLSLNSTEHLIILEYRKADEITRAMVLKALSIDGALNVKGKEELA
ncbi:MAG: hypothetical protein MR308_10055 [Lachnospiraceae bacterium]|nr:hypothetical protein [Lachnospiraceae bacterium]